MKQKDDVLIMNDESNVNLLMSSYKILKIICVAY